MMRQILQNLSTGETVLAETPAPALRSGTLLVRTRSSLLSAGTERMLLEFGRASLLGKARQQPERVAQVLAKVKTEGLFATLQSVREKLDQPLPLGYCNAGVVLAIGEGVRGFSVGDRVASNGPHAEVVCVPERLCAKIPEPVATDEAAFAIAGAIALQGVRLLVPTLGERVVVIGLGLLGLLAVQILRANGCAALGVDFDPARRALAEDFGASAIDPAKADPVATAAAFAPGGADAVLLAAATKSDEPVHQAAAMCRKRGRIVLLGVTGLHLDRNDFYKKELTFQVSCSYGPGRHESDYEEAGRDYPPGFVRWTAQRNFQAVLELLSERKLRVAPLITHRIPFDEAPRAYELLGGAEPSLGILLSYPEPEEDAPPRPAVTVAMPQRRSSRAAHAAPVVGLLGAGQYATRFLLPAFARAGVKFRTVVSSGGLSASHAAERFGFENASTDPAAVLDDATIDTVVIATRHDSHARYALSALKRGKHVFVEKPLALRRTELDELEAALHASSAPPLLTVGFNRRFSPLLRIMKDASAALNRPKAFVYTVNAGPLPAEHWLRDPVAGGGRILGEVCHFVDLLRFLAGAPLVKATPTALHGPDGDASLFATLVFADGSTAALQYLVDGHPSYPKERLELFAAGAVLQLDNFRTLRSFGWPGRPARRIWRQDKGQFGCVRAFVEAVRTAGPAPIPLEELFEVSRACFDLAEAMPR